MRRVLLATSVLLAATAGLWLAVRPSPRPRERQPVVTASLPTSPPSFSSFSGPGRLAAPISDDPVAALYAELPPGVVAQLAQASQEPIIAPVFFVASQLAEGEVHPGDKPLVAKVHHVEARALDTISDQPLIPRTIPAP